MISEMETGDQEQKLKHQASKVILDYIARPTGLHKTLPQKQINVGVGGTHDSCPPLCIESVVSPGHSASCYASALCSQGLQARRVLCGQCDQSEVVQGNQKSGTVTVSL